MQLYEKSLTTDLENNYVKPVTFQYPQPELLWYLPHHPVTNPNKPGKVRRVANAASTYKGVSLNPCLETGPDLLNNMFVLLLRFREKPVAVSTVIEGMFMQKSITDKIKMRFASFGLIKMVSNNTNTCDLSLVPL